MINTGRLERARRQRIVQREMERPRTGMATRVSFPPGIGAESSLSSRASTPATPQPFDIRLSVIVILLVAKLVLLIVYSRQM